ncbi:MAG TPA: LysR family transcriptional regulator [Mariprofundaceae bacterium]|nr:LysR family transcriptional regulator [Mariprofundaceae bacterium]
MHIDLIKTFLQVAKARHFRKASDQLYITQSAVSARIKQLEQTLGVQLFARNKHDVSLTPAGIRFFEHAERLMKTWNRACHEVMLPEQIETSLVVGATDTIWSVFLTDWIVQIQQRQPDLAIWAELHTFKTLLPSLLDGMLDLAVMFDVPALPGLYIQELPTISFVMVSSQPQVTADQALQSGFISVDWGEAFAAAFGQHFSHQIVSTRYTSVGSVALDLLLKSEGSAYLPKQMVMPYVEGGKLYLVDDAPQMERPVFAVCTNDGGQNKPVKESIDTMILFLQSQ